MEIEHERIFCLVPLLKLQSLCVFKATTISNFAFQYCEPMLLYDRLGMFYVFCPTRLQSSPLIEQNAKTMQVIYWSLIEESIFQPCTILLFICNCILYCEQPERAPIFRSKTWHSTTYNVAFHLGLAKEIPQKCTYEQLNVHNIVVAAYAISQSKYCNEM